ncbi:hypothetical protein KCU68_g50, partial [Aureobasidium melanogenum]
MPKTPGFLWCSGFIALNRCVIIFAPAATAADASSYVASVCHVSDFRSGRQFFDVGQIVNTVTSFEIGERCGRL